MNVRRRPLAASVVAALLTLAAPTAFAATTWTVTDCAETSSGNAATHSGSLRFAVANAASGDVVDMSGLTCSAITLQTGAIVIAQDSLSLIGPGMDKLTLVGPQPPSTLSDRVIYHGSTSGELYLRDLALSHGTVLTSNGGARGGCLYSSSNVTLQRVAVHDCVVVANRADSGGGGVFAAQQLVLRFSRIVDNGAYNVHGAASYGGGAFAGLGLSMKYSTISGNHVASTSSPGGDYAGGLSAGDGGNITIVGSTIANNTSDGVYGGVFLHGGADIRVANSTISGNRATGPVGGMVIAQSAGYSTRIENSTFAFNVAGVGKGGATSGYLAAGLALYGRSPATLTLQSVLLANNAYGTIASDLSAEVDTNVGGANNLVRAARGPVTLPADTLAGVCPLLGPLRDNGGLTQTHALLSGSPAIDTGNNSAGFGFDQRGSVATNGVHSFARASGAGVDIGAYEVQQDDIVFNNGFEGCP